MIEKTDTVESIISNNIVRPLFKPVFIYISFTAIFTINVLIYIISNDFYQTYFCGEDKVIEWITFFAYFMCSISGCAVLLFYRKYMNKWTIIYLFGLSFFLFICAGEEISWGQRILGFATPEGLIEHNQQKEFNIHNINIEVIHPRDIIGIFNYMWGFILPIGFFLKYRSKGSTWRRYIFSPVAAPCFFWAEFLNFIIKPIHKYWGPGMETATYQIIINQTEEMVEMFWGLSALVGMLSLYIAWHFFSTNESDALVKSTHIRHSRESVNPEPVETIGIASFRGMANKG